MKQDIRDAWRAVRASGTPDTTQVGDALCERLGTAERMVHELQKDNTRLVEERRAAERSLRLDDPKLVAALKNVGVDAACGACMAQFLTGTAPYEHTCGA